MPKLAQRIVKKTMQTMGAGNTSSACELLKIFFQELQSGSLNLKQLHAEKDYKKLAMAAHKMAGACAYFGAEALYVQLLKIESLAKKPPVTEDFSEALERTFQLLDEAHSSEQVVFKLLNKLGA